MKRSIAIAIPTAKRIRMGYMSGPPPTKNLTIEYKASICEPSVTSLSILVMHHSKIRRSYHGFVSDLIS